MKNTRAAPALFGVLLFACMATTHAEQLKPFLPHLASGANYTPSTAWTKLQNNGFAAAVVNQANAFHGTSWTVNDITTAIAERSFSERFIVGAWGSGGYQVLPGSGLRFGTIFRGAYPGEMGVYIDDKLVYSLKCGNPPHRPPEELAMRCMEGSMAESVTEITVLPQIMGGGVIFSAPAVSETHTAESHTFECQF